MFVSFISYTTGVTWGAGTVNPFRAPDFNLCFYSSRVLRSLVFCVMICRSLFVLLSFGHCIVCPSSLTRLLITPLVSFGHCNICPSSLTTSDYPFVIFWPLYCLSVFAYDFWLRSYGRHYMSFLEWKVNQIQRMWTLSTKRLKIPKW